MQRGMVGAGGIWGWKGCAVTGLELCEEQQHSPAAGALCCGHPSLRPYGAGVMPTLCPPRGPGHPLGSDTPQTDLFFSPSGAESPCVTADVGAVCDHLVLSPRRGDAMLLLWLRGRIPPVPCKTRAAAPFPTHFSSWDFASLLPTVRSWVMGTLWGGKGGGLHNPWGWGNPHLLQNGERTT